jgi:F-type H+-transporting ATPase subunit gamma
MLSSTTKFGSLLVMQGVQSQQRGMATLKDIQMRLKSVKNIQKITQSMKMVSAAKYARAERDLKAARPYGLGAQAFYESTQLIENVKKPDHLFVAMTSDRGLCGSCHTSVARMIRLDMAELSKTHNIRIVCVGDKSTAVLKRLFAKNIVMSFNELGRLPPTFNDARTIAQGILASGFDFAQGDLIYNRFRTVVSYTTLKMPFFSVAQVQASENIGLYDSVDDNVMLSYVEYSLASLIYHAMKESACSEQSSRMTAMDGASKNAGEMINKLSLYYNRTRQAVITRELIEIISGAAAL